MNIRLPAWAYLEGGTPGAPSSPQQEFLQLLKAHDRVFFLGGLGAGKTWVGGWAFLLMILRNRFKMTADGRSGRLLYIAGAPEYQSVDVGCFATLNEILDEFESLNGFDLRKRVTKTPPKWIHLVTGDSIVFVTLDAGRYKGATAAGGWVDEIEESEDAIAGYNLIQKRVRSAKAPRRFVIATSTPGIEGQGLLELWNARMADTLGDGPSYALVHASTKSNPAHAGTGYYEQLAAAMSPAEVAARLEGKPQPPASRVYAREFDRRHSIAWRWQDWRRIDTGQPPLKEREFWLALDWGSHYSALLIEHDPISGVDVIIDELHRDGGQDNEFLDAVVKMHRSWGIGRQDITGVWADKQPRESFNLAWKKRYWPGRVSGKRMDERRKKGGIKTVKWRLNPSQGPRLLLLAPHLLTSPYRRGIAAALYNYQWRERAVAGQVVQLARVNQEHWASHACDALRYYCYGRYGSDRLKAIGQAA